MATDLFAELDPLHQLGGTFPKIDGSLLYFRFFTNLKLKKNVHQFRALAVRRLGCWFTGKTLMVVLKEVKKKNENEKPHTTCEIIHFKEDEKWNAPNTFICEQAIGSFKNYFSRWLEIDVESHTITIEYPNFKNKVLIDWRAINPLLTSASAPVWTQKGPTCWAYAIAGWLGKNSTLFSEEQENVVVSPMDLIDWVYSIQELYKDSDKKKKGREIIIDKFGTYGCPVVPALTYAKEKGVALLENYELKIEERELEFTRKDEDAFEVMRRAKGPRIFPEDVQYYEHNLNLESMMKHLNFGVIIGSMKLCVGCAYCGKGFSGFKGVYTIPPHPKTTKFTSHLVQIIGAGNMNGLDFVRIVNSHGISWGKNGVGDIDIKLFRFVARLGGVKKKSWNDNANEWT